MDRSLWCKLWGIRVACHHSAMDVTATPPRWKDWERWIATSERKDSEISRKGNHFQEQKPGEDSLTCTPHHQIWFKWNKGSKHIGQTTLKSLMSWLGIIRQKFQKAAKPKDTWFCHEWRKESPPLDSRFHWWHFHGHLDPGVLCLLQRWEAALGWDLQHVERRCSLGSVADLDFRRPCKRFVRCEISREHSGAVCWEAPKHPGEHSWRRVTASTRCPQNHGALQHEQDVKIKWAVS